jgi:hypothetical protein
MEFDAYDLHNLSGLERGDIFAACLDLYTNGLISSEEVRFISDNSTQV